MSKIMIKLNIVLLAIIVSTGFGYGQSRDMEIIHSGDAAMKKGSYTQAIQYYLQVVNFTADSSQANSNDQVGTYYPYSMNSRRNLPQPSETNTKEKIQPTNDYEGLTTNKIANAYCLAKDYSNSEKWYARAMEFPSNEFPNAAYHYGCALMNNKKYNEAKSEFEKLIEQRGNQEDPISKLASNKIKSCDYAIHESLSHKTPSIKLMGNDINSGSSSFGMMYYEEGLIFASSLASSPENSDIYLIEEDNNGNFSAPLRFEGEANSPEIEGAATISRDGKIMYFTRVDRLDPNNVSIYILRNFNGNWLKPFKLGDNVNLEGYKSMMPSLGGDGETLYFSSNRPGGSGGMDIWKTTIDQMGEATEPINLGKEINTSEDDVSPFYHAGSKTLYFSSKGHLGFGGFDVFKSTFNILTDTWNSSDNLGPSVNSSMDDTYFIWGEDMKHGYLTSDREGCISCESPEIFDIHCNKIYEVNNPSFEIKIEGYVYDMETNAPIPNATVEFKDIRGVIENVSITSDEDGHYVATLLENKEYFLKSIKNGYFADAMVKSTMGMVRPRSLMSNFYLNKIPTTEIEIKGIEYDFDSDVLREDAKKVLNNIVELLQLNSNLKVEIRSHTDSRGVPIYNLDLSQRRAQNVVHYLVNHGVNASRLIALGKGSSEPAVIDIKGKEVQLTDEFIMSHPDEKSQEEYYQLNRRTAFKVIGQ